MLKSRVCTWSLTWLLGSLAWSAPGQADACWWWGRRSTYMVPVVAAPTPVVANFAPSCCAPAPQQVCQMVPQTAYRMQSVSVPVTSFMPVAAVDGCTGCPTTTMRPVTSFVQQTQMVPYTTYRQVCQSVCPTTTVLSPVTVAAPVVSVAPAAGCSTCSASIPAMATSATVIAPQAAIGPTTADVVPALPQGSVPQTFQQQAAPTTPGAAGSVAPQSGSQTELKPVPDNTLHNGGETTTGGASTNSAISPRWSDPRNRTAMQPSGAARSYNTVSRMVDLRGVPPQTQAKDAPTPAAAVVKAPAPAATPAATAAVATQAEPALDFGGWRASSR